MPSSSRFSAPSLLIDSDRLHTLLADAAWRFHVDAIETCESTNTLLLDRAAAGLPSGSVIVADRQTAGRGSRGRQWLASPEASLTFSVLWSFPGGMERLAGLSLAVGVAVIQALEACGARDLTLKWPNDILYRDAKLGGILIELQMSGERALAVIGIGLNLSLPDKVADAHGFALPPTALDGIVDPLPDRHVLFAQLLIALAEVFDRFASGGFAAVREQWLKYHAWQDKPVRLLRDERVEEEGICRGADADGALLVEAATGIKHCLSGDLSLRPL